MKDKKISLISFVLLLYFSFSLQGAIPLFNSQDERDHKNVGIQLSTVNTHIYDWDRTWGGISHGDYGSGVAIDSLDNIYLAGRTESFGAGSDDMVLVKYDNSGVQQWNRTWGGYNYEYGSGVAVDSSDNVYLAGYTYEFGAGGEDMVLVKYDNSGVQQWNRTWGGISNEFGGGVAVDSSNNVYLVGSTRSFTVGINDMFIVKYNSSGVQQWNHTWGGDDNEEGWGVAVDSSDNVYLVGKTVSFGVRSEDMIIVKYDSSGVQQWNHTWGGWDNEVGKGVVVDSLDNVYLVGSTRSFGEGERDMVLVKYDNSGVQQWNRTWGGISDEYGTGVAVDSSNNIYLSGSSSSSMVLVKYDSAGIHQWNRFWQERDFNGGRGVAVDSSDNVYNGGDTSYFGLEGDMVLVKYLKVPEIIIISPSQDEKFREIAPDFHISILEPNITSMWYTIDGGINNYTFYQFTGKINQTAWDIAPYGDIWIVFYAEDHEGKIGNSDVVVKKVKEREQAISGYPLLLFVIIIGMITVISLNKRLK